MIGGGSRMERIGLVGGKGIRGDFQEVRLADPIVHGLSILGCIVKPSRWPYWILKMGNIIFICGIVFDII